MALSTELLKRLNSDEEPLPKRLKLAENAFYIDDIPIVRKEDLVLQWLCKMCLANQNVWSSLNRCLKTTHLVVKVDVKKLLIKALVTRLQENVNDVDEQIFECCRLTVSNNGMQQYFINNPKDLGLLLKCLLDYALKFFKETFSIKEGSTDGIDITLISKSDGLTSIAYNTAISVIESTIQIFKSAFVTKDSLRTIFVHDILYPLCVIIDHKHTDNTNRLGAVAHKCIQQIIFGKKHTKSGTVLTDENTAQFADLLSVLAENAKTKDLQSNSMTFVFIFRAAISTFKSDSCVLDLLLRGLVECAGIHKRQILNSLLRHLNDTAFDFDNKVHGVTLFDYCQKLIDDILASEDTSSIDYELLTQFCSFNPLIIEKRIPNILKRIFVGGPTLEYTNLMVSILDATVHLRQEEKLISAILMSLKHSLNQISDAKVDMFFPDEFKGKFMKIVNNITNSQGVNILRTLIYHLKTDCMEVLQSNEICEGKDILIMQATVELLVTLLDGVCIFEYTGTLTSHQKFVNALDDLRITLSLLVDKILHLNHSKKVIVILLTVIFSWNEAQKALKYYVPKAVTRDLTFPISQDQWQQLVQRITNFGKDNCKNSMNKLILQQLRMSRNELDESSVKRDSLIGGLEYSWRFILKFNTDVISLLANKEVSKLAHLLLTDMTSNGDSFCEWLEVLHKHTIQEDKRFVICLLCCIITQIGHLTTEGVTKSMSKHIAAKALLNVELVENGKIDEILTYMKEKLSKAGWVQIESTSLCTIKMHLKVLLHMPLIFLDANTRLITFMFVFALRKECNQDDEIISLCNTIFSDLLEKPGLDTFQYIDPSLLLQQLPRNRIIQKAVELSLRHNLSYTTLKKLIKSSTLSKESMYFLLESMEHIKPKLNVDQKAILRKAERKLSKIIIKTLPSTIIGAVDVKTLCLILKFNITNENIDEDTKDLVDTTLRNIFANDTDRNNKNELLQEGLQLAVVILRNRRIFQVTNKTVNGIWHALFQYPCIDVLLPLLESSEPKEFHEFLEYLHNQMVQILSNMEEDKLENVCIIWNAVLKTNMSVDRSKLRLVAINKLIQVIHVVNISDNVWPSLLKLMQNILAAKHLYLPGNIIDISIFLGLKSLQESTILTCNDALALCNILLRTRTSLITDRLPALLVLYRRILNVVVHRSKTIDNKSEELVFKCLALDIEKFTSALIKLKKDVARLTPYLIADLLQLFSEASIAASVKASIQTCIHLLISICDQHGTSLLCRTLPISMQEIFKTQLDEFNKFYKFSGKI